MPSQRINALAEELLKLSPDEARLVAQLLEIKLGIQSPISDLLIAVVEGAASASAAAPVDDFESFLPGDSSTDAPPPEDKKSNL